MHFRFYLRPIASWKAVVFGLIASPCWRGCIPSRRRFRPFATGTAHGTLRRATLGTYESRGLGSGPSRQHRRCGASTSAQDRVLRGRRAITP